MDNAAEQRPAAMLTTASIAPMAREAIATIDRRRLAGWHRGRANQRRRVVAPYLLGGAVVHDAEKPADHAEHAIGPAARHVACAKRYLDVVEGAEIHFIAAPTPRLQDAEKPDSVHFGDGLGQDPAPVFLLQRTPRELRDQRPGADDQLRRLGRDRAGALRPLHCASPGKSRLA